MNPERVEPQETEPKVDESDQRVELKTIEPKTIELHTVQREVAECQTIEPQTPETQSADPMTVEPQLSDPQNVEAKDLLCIENKGQPTVGLSTEYRALVLWRQPILTLLYFLKESFVHTKNLFWIILQFQKILKLIISVLFIVLCLNNTHSPNIPTFFWLQKKFLWCLYWFCLGMLSAVGLGAGIHTFVLYLSPYIENATVLGHGCGYLNFGEHSYTGVIECPVHTDDPDPRWATTFWNIMCKVRLESYMWGLGTAIGELPPYFMGRATHISRRYGERDEITEFEDLQRKRNECPESITRLDRIKLTVRDVVVNAGFWGILVCASIPNPFFDLVGITCGNFLIPFWTFFGATLIGKTVIKTTIQQVFIIVSFNNAFLTGVVEILSKIPVVGQRLHKYFSQYIASQKDKVNDSWIMKVYHIGVVCMFLYVFITIINSLAQNHYKRLEREKLRKNE